MRKARNNYAYFGDIAKVYLTNKGGVVIAHALLDAKNVDKCTKYHWSFRKDGYAWNNKVGFMHNFILGRDTSDRSIVCDHIDQNKLNNIENNLRIVSQSKNMHNCGIHKDNTSGFRGVSYIKNQRKKGWRSRICLNGKVHEKFFYTKKEAIAFRKGMEEMI